MRSFVVSCSLAVLVCVLVGSIEAEPQLRQKRALSQEKCPEKMTHEECVSWAENKAKEMKECVRHEITGTNIEWADCGSVHCSEANNTKEVPADLSKAYPDCCPRCEAIDPSKPAVWSAVGK